VEQWYYFVRNGDRITPKTRAWSPPRPEDANPDNGDPLTPWYETTDHYDDTHVHVRAASEAEATRIAITLISGRNTP
jgi:hypothetical protein